MKNLKNKPVETLLSLYRESAYTHGQATLSGDYKVANKAADSIDAIFREIRNRDVIKSFFSPLLSDENVSVRLWASSHILPFFHEDAEKVLTDISISEKSIFRLDAEMTLKQWKKGELWLK